MAMEISECKKLGAVVVKTSIERGLLNNVTIYSLSKKFLFLHFYSTEEYNKEYGTKG